MKWLARLLITLAAIQLLLHYLAYRIKTQPNPYPPAKIRRPLDGQETYLPRENGACLWTITKGQGRPVILAHGYGVDSQEWNLIWDQLVESGYQVIAFDLRGHGQSDQGESPLTADAMTADYAAVLDYYNVRDGILVAHSTGGFLGLRFILNDPQLVAERLAGAVIVASMAGNILEGSLQNRLQIPLIQLGVMEKVASTEPYKWLFGASLFGDTPFPAAIEVFNDMFLKNDHQALIPILQCIAVEDHYGRLAEIDIPCVILCGEADKTTPRWHSIEMGERIPDARNIWLPGKGHLLNWEAPDAIIEAIRLL